MLSHNPEHSHLTLRDRLKEITGQGSPIVIVSALDILAGMIGLAMLRGYDTRVLATFGLGQTITIMGIVFLAGISPAVISQLAKHNVDQHARITFNGVALAFMMGATLISFIYLIMDLGWLDFYKDPFIVTQFKTYIHWSAWILVFFVIQMAFGAYLIYKQKTWFFLQIYFLTKIPQLCAAYYLIHHGWGIEGFMMTMLIQNIADTVLYGWYVSRLQRLNCWRLWDTSILKDLWAVAWPTGVQLWLVLLGINVLLLIFEYIGPNEVVIATLVLNLIRLVVLPCKAFGSVTAARAARCFVLNQPHAAKAWVNTGILLVYMLVIPVALIFLIWPDWPLGLYLPNADLPHGHVILRLAGISLLLEPYGSFLSTILFNEGLAKKVLVGSTLYQWAVALPAAGWMGCTLGMGAIIVWLWHISTRIVLAIACAVIWYRFLNSKGAFAPQLSSAKPLKNADADLIREQPPF